MAGIESKSVLGNSRPLQLTKKGQSTNALAFFCVWKCSIGVAQTNCLETTEGTTSSLGGRLSCRFDCFPEGEEVNNHEKEVQLVLGGV